MVSAYIITVTNQILAHTITITMKVLAYLTTITTEILGNPPTKFSPGNRLVLSWMVEILAYLAHYNPGESSILYHHSTSDFSVPHRYNHAEVLAHLVH